jgi:hypothetical protein
MESIMDWCKVLVYVAGLWSVLMEYLQESRPEFKAWPPMWKRLLFGAVCVVVRVAAAALGVLTCGWSPTWADTFWPAVAAGLMAIGSGTTVHMFRLRHCTLPVPEERPFRDDGGQRPKW